MNKPFRGIIQNWKELTGVMFGVTMIAMMWLLVSATSTVVPSGEWVMSIGPLNVAAVPVASALPWAPEPAVVVTACPVKETRGVTTHCFFQRNRMR